MASRIGGLGLVIAGLGLAGCGGDESSAGGAQPPAWEPGSSNVLYGPLGESDTELFPSNRYSHPDAASATGLRVEISPRTVVSSSQLYGFQTSVDELNELDGFSPVGGVIAKFDGTPAYQLAVVCDDHAMQVTEVLRGDDLLPSAFRQIELYDFFGWSVPQFARSRRPFPE